MEAAFTVESAIYEDKKLPPFQFWSLEAEAQQDSIWNGSLAMLLQKELTAPRSLHEDLNPSS